MRPWELWRGLQSGRKRAFGAHPCADAGKAESSQVKSGGQFAHFHPNLRKQGSGLSPFSVADRLDPLVGIQE
jgi:hypothetical protein